MVDDAANLLLELADSNPNTSYLCSNISKAEKNIFNDIEIQNFQSNQASSETFGSHITSPDCNTLQINSPNFGSPVRSPSGSSAATDIPLQRIFSGFSDTANIPHEAFLPYVKLECIEGSPVYSQDSISSSSADDSGNTDSNPATSYFSDISKAEKNDILKDVDVQNSQCSQASSEISDSHTASAGCNILQINSPKYASPVHSPSGSSAAANILYKASIPYIKLECVEGSPVYSRDSISSSSLDGCGNTNSNPATSVTVCDQVNNDEPENVLEFEEPRSIGETSNSVRNKEYVNNEKEIPNEQVILKNASNPYEEASSKLKERRERKKALDKEAAARYRIKKRMEEKEISEKVANLESEQKNLKQKHDELQTEIKYLKSLMREILQKKGILK